MLDIICKKAKLLNSLETLNLSYNSELLGSSEFTDAVCLLLSQQTALKQLDLGGNDLSSDATDKIMSSLKDS